MEPCSLIDSRCLSSACLPFRLLVPLPILLLSRLLYLTAAALVLAGGGIALWAATNPVKAKPLPVAQSVAATRPVGSPLEDVMNLSLRPAPAIKVQVIPLRVKLAGTVVDGANSQAMLVDAQGQTQFVKVGESVEDVKVLSITATSIEVEYQGNKQTLEVAP